MPPLIDVTRLVWRAWAGSVATGVDKVCRAYLDHFGAGALAVLQRGGARAILGSGDSRALFEILGRAEQDVKARLARFLPGALMRAVRSRDVAGRLYLNVGHTGLNFTGLPEWIARKRLRAVFFIHDLIPLTHPEFCRAGEAERHRQRIRHALQCASGIVANSHATLETLRTFAGEEGLAMPPALPAWIAGHPVLPDVEPAMLDRPHFIVVGTIEGRKNHLLLLHVWQRLAARLGADTPKLVIVGKRGWEAEQVLAMLDRSPGLRGHIVELGNASDAQVASLLAGARALLMPSHVEGFGIPLVEAMQAGVPVAASDQPAHREIGGAIPLYLRDDDGPEWERAVLDLLGDGAERSRQLSALEDYRPPQWPTHFEEVDRFLAKLVAEARTPSL